MSIILDALKKSDTERQRQSTPGIASIPAANAGRSSSRWFWIIGLLLVLNLAAVAFLINRTGESSASPAEAETVPSSPSTTPTLPIERPAVSAAAPVEGSEPAAITPQPAQESSIATSSRSNQAPAIETTRSTTAPPPPGPTVADNLPTFDELRARGVLQLPDLYIDIHVYSDNPAERFIFVNMSKYKERAKLAEGPVVAEITPDGVVLDYLGTAFLLPRE